MDHHGNDETPSAGPPAHPMAHEGLRLVPGSSTIGRPRRGHRSAGPSGTSRTSRTGRTNRVELVTDGAPVRSPWSRPDDERGPWTRDEIRAELHAFHGSPTGAHLSTEQRIALADLLLSDESPIVFDGYCGLFWANEVLAPGLPGRLTDTPIAYLRQLPAALRAWVRHCHRHERWVDAEMTLAVLDGIDGAEPGWQYAVEQERERRHELRPYHLAKLAEYTADVGGEEALWTLDDAPLPDEPLLLEGIDPDTAVIVLAAAERCDLFFDRFDDLRLGWVRELRTVARRLLSRLGRDAPDALRRPAAASIAAAVVYASLHGNVIPKRGGVLSTNSIATAVGAGPSGVAARARNLLGALGVEQHRDRPGLPARLRRRHLRLGSPALLISDHRTFLVSEAAYLRRRLYDTGG